MEAQAKVIELAILKKYNGPLRRYWFILNTIDGRIF